MAGLVGEFEVKLDSKGRFLFPSGLRKQLAPTAQRDFMLNKGFEEFGNAVHPVVKTHPVSKKKFLYINPSFTSQIVGMTTTDSNNLLSYLFNFMNKPEFQIRFQWTSDTLVIWDNRCTMHKANSDYNVSHLRIMHRVMLEGEAVF